MPFFNPLFLLFLSNNKVWKDLTARIDLELTKSNLVATPADDRAEPVEELSIFEIYSCEHCDYVSVKEGSLKEHCTCDYGWVKGQGQS
jgi:hypothetical protein